MPSTDLHFAKSSALPSETAWSHVYHAGSVFAVISLSTQEPRGDESVSVIGKEFLNNLEAEFFGLEEKSLTSIKEAITESIKEIPKDVLVSLCLAYTKDDVLYVFGIGGGKAMLKRDERVGTLLPESEESADRTIHAASGYLKHGDNIILATRELLAHIPHAEITDILNQESADQAEEALTTKLESEENVAHGSAGIVMFYRPATSQEESETPPTVVHAPLEGYEKQDDHTLTEPMEEEAQLPHMTTASYERVAHTAHKKIPSMLGKLQPLVAKLPNVSKLPKTKVLILIGAVVILVMLVGSIYSTQKKRHATKNTALFTQVYTDAKKNYDLGVQLKGLTKSIALEDFQKAKNTIDSNKGKFPADSDEAKQLAELEAKIDTELQGAAAVHATQATEVSADTDALLKAETDQSGAIAASQDDSKVYVMTKTEIFQDSKSVLKAGSDWSDPVGFAAYSGNLYVLDRKNGVLKYVAGSDGYGKGSYFKDGKPDLSKVQSVAIDGSIWLLTSDSILKYTKGSQDTFSISGLPNAFSSPTRIVTSVDMTNMYVLDRGNSRILKIKKDGTYQAQYSADVLGKATDLDISEKDNTAFVLSSGKVYKLSLQ